MILYCSTCGKKYSDVWKTSECKICGGLLEHSVVVEKQWLQYKDYILEQEWWRWRNLIKTAPPRALSEKAWLYACTVFGGCALCGCENIDEKLLVVPISLGGKLYTYNILPACNECATKVLEEQGRNPLKVFYKNFDEDKIAYAFEYLETMIYSDTFELFNFDEDKIEIIVKVVEDTSALPFNGVYAKRVPVNNSRVVEAHRRINPKDRDGDTLGIYFRLL